MADKNVRPPYGCAMPYHGSVMDFHSDGIHSYFRELLTTLNDCQVDLRDVAALERVARREA